MYELTAAVHCLHNGGNFHRDIQSANIWLSDDYTAQLMDCGLAKFVPIISNAAFYDVIGGERFVAFWNQGIHVSRVLEQHRLGAL
jgi:serine/threonine protein kinase